MGMNQKELDWALFECLPGGPWGVDGLEKASDFLGLGANPSRPSHDRGTHAITESALGRAAKMGHEPMVELMLSSPLAEPNRQSINQKLPISEAISGGFVEIVRLLAPRTRLSFELSRWGRGEALPSPLGLAILRGRTQCFMAMIEAISSEELAKDLDDMLSWTTKIVGDADNAGVRDPKRDEILRWIEAQVERRDLAASLAPESRGAKSPRAL